ncbi:TIGR03617 family F420-dependent LLM class oxidoreductase [Egicoccus halophilus]|uniref:LLM class F420-dependent oxidoreductase n=1 Tax=Egicoccus halophilus TaxID=1670830 RepID=A0A8J3EYP2_9ACTN|nr:TIGR03617 family F420-dependent LLM class oxidoreductase [Egicoccus halophilus]GGI08294.1 LLM class F420-dependent oxidoreductase [Egicoccus halophilus]
MKLDAMLLGTRLPSAAGSAAAAEAAGYDGWFTGETAHEPLLACTAAGAATSRLQVGTAIAVAFPRSPMHVAQAAWDLQDLTGGRFVLGLGSQVKAHVEKRFSATWSAPAARMREHVQALRAIWHAWATGERLAHRGEFYRHTLMTPFFTPPDHGHGAPPVWLAAVGPRMTEVAGEVADGLLCHGFTTDRYLREVTLPALTAGARRAGRDRDGLEVVLPVFAVTGHDDAEVAASEAFVRQQIAFYGSTPAYRPVLDLHGWGGLHEQLHARSLRGEWEAMAAAIDDEVLHTFALVAPPDRLGTEIRDRYAGLADRVSLYTPFVPSVDDVARLVRDLAG